MSQMPDEKKARRRKAATAGLAKAQEKQAPIEHDVAGPTRQLGGANAQARSGREHLSKPKQLATRRQHRGGK